MEKMSQDGPKWGQEDFFLLIQTLPTFWATQILIFRFFFVVVFLDPDFLDFQVPGNPAWAKFGPGWAKLG